MLEEFPSDARASIVSFLDFVETWRFSILVTHRWKTLLENPKIWSESVVNLSGVLCPITMVIASKIFPLIRSASKVMIDTRETPWALRWLREFEIVWRFNNKCTEWTHDGHDCTTLLLSSQPVPWYINVEFRWRGFLDAIEIGLTSAASKEGYTTHIDSDPTERNDVSTFFLLRFNERFANCKGWFINIYPMDDEQAKDARNFVKNDDGLQSLQCSVEWSLDKVSFALGGQTVDSRRYGCNPRTPAVRSGSFFFTRLYFRASPAAWIEVLSLPTQVPKLRGGHMNWHCIFCNFESTDAECICPFCLDFFCYKHGGECTTCLFFGCGSCLTSDAHVCIV